MAGGGRPRKPIELKLVQGTARKDRMPKNPLKVPPCQIKAPKFLNEVARVEWERMVALLYPQGLTTELDVAALASYCHSWALLQDAEKAIAEFGALVSTDKGEPKKNPAVDIANEQKKIINTYCGKFGLTPSDRAKMESPKGQDDVDPMEQLIAGGAR